MRVEAKRVIIGLLQEYARKTEELTAKEKEDVKNQQKQANQEWKREITSNPDKYLNLSGMSVYENDEANVLRRKLDKQFPLAGISYGGRETAGVKFLALNFDVLVRGAEKIRKFQSLSKQIDNAFLEGNAVNLVALIKKTLGN